MNMKNKFIGNIVFVFLSVLIIFICSGCATLRHPVPSNMIGKAHVDNMSDIRTFYGDRGSELAKNALLSFKEENITDYPVNSDGKRVYPLLCISGGSANGAYGAGLLNGWSKEGSRPKFKAITGVSTGAIIAPLVFLGEEYDDMVENLYTTMATKQVMTLKGPLRALFGNSLASNKPLEKQLDKYITDDILKKIADEHKRGRRLYVGTTYLDAQRFVIWDMGAIALRGDAKLFRKVILASAAIPMVFPPVFIKVEDKGKIYDEMHVDGGTLMQAFSLYKIFEGEEENAKKMGIDPEKIKADYYIIRNGYFDPSYKVVDDELASIGGQTFDTMINSQGIGDAYRIYAFMQRRGNTYNLAFIPGDFRPPKKEEFDPSQMKMLFDKGYEDAVNGYKWSNVPPGLDINRE